MDIRTKRNVRSGNGKVMVRIKMSLKKFLHCRSMMGKPCPLRVKFWS